MSVSIFVSNLLDMLVFFSPSTAAPPILLEGGKELDRVECMQQAPAQQMQGQYILSNISVISVFKSHAYPDNFQDILSILSVYSTILCLFLVYSLYSLDMQTEGLSYHHLQQQSQAAAAAAAAAGSQPEYMDTSQTTPTGIMSLQQQQQQQQQTQQQQQQQGALSYKTHTGKF